MDRANKAGRIHFGKLKNPVVLLALGFGSGLAPKAPGTAGTLVAVPLCFVLQQVSLLHYALFTLALIIAGIWICAYTADKLGVHDHPAIVIDEVAGFLVTMFALPPDWQWLLAGFILFRLFDVLKPWPISWLDQHVKGGTGIMIDDVAAGLVSLGLLQAGFYLTGL